MSSAGNSTNAHAVRAELVGTVCEVLVAPGARVRADEALVVLDSMKMEIPVQAPMAATVLRMDVAVGDVVSAGDVLAVLVPD
ncbi:MAG: biotin/lipoyl-binding carrier protein [Sporichthyaceae bacterium]